MRNIHGSLAKSKSEPSIRLLKVYYKFRMNIFSTKKVPEIRLCGNWLENIGFKEGDDIVVSLDKRRIEICLFSSDEVFQNQTPDFSN